MIHLDIREHMLRCHDGQVQGILRVLDGKDDELEARS
jgi:hypothetical protein